MNCNKKMIDVNADADPDGTEFLYRLFSCLY